MDLTGHARRRGLPFVERPRFSSPTAITAILVVFSLIFWLDWSTGAAPVQHLYYLPIIFAAARFGRRGGLSAALLAIVCYHVANARPLSVRYAESDVLQMAVFVAVGMVADKLADDRRRLHRLAMTDDLTGLHNLRSFEAQLTRMVQAARETNTSIALLVLDLDRLKSLNDVHGHLAGAEAVRTVGQILATTLPAESAACRYGGDEFVIALPEHDGTEAARIAEALRGAVQAAAPTLAGIAFPAATLSISVGVAHRTLRAGAPADEDTEVAKALFLAADGALYAAKNGGRNRVSASRPGGATSPAA